MSDTVEEEEEEGLQSGRRRSRGVRMGVRTQSQTILNSGGAACVRHERRTVSYEGVPRVTVFFCHSLPL